MREPAQLYMSKGGNKQTNGVRKNKTGKAIVECDKPPSRAPGKVSIGQDSRKKHQYSHKQSPNEAITSSPRIYSFQEPGQI